MKAIVLCAGYATRLYPLTLDQPKPLLPVGGKPILEHILAQIAEIPDVDEVFLITNAKFRRHFDEWKKKLSYSRPVTVLNDDSMTNDDRLGAIRDLDLVLETARVQEDTLVVAGDNVFRFSLRDFTDYARSKSPDITVGCVDLGSREEAHRYGVIDLAPDRKMRAFLEKPKDPPSSLVSMGLYYFPKSKLARIKEFLKNRENPDAPGYFIQWLLEHDNIWGYPFEGVWYDIGDMNSYESANRLFASKT
ncbi:MAG: nucleotidyltransferase family protein [Candidatus Omnitrophica bacterium]|nr:nucleotidyltransferase family protein [Candidatus Omnitrophota bacterium]